MYQVYKNHYFTFAHAANVKLFNKMYQVVLIFAKSVIPIMFMAKNDICASIMSIAEFWLGFWLRAFSVSIPTDVRG